jgi:hypothetical protein
MKPNTLKIIMSLAAALAVAGAQFVKDPTAQQGLTSLGGLLLGWAHGPRPGDTKA